MHSNDDSDLSSFQWESQSHSHLLSESPLVVPSSSSSSASPTWRGRQDAPATGPGGADLSLSELSLYDRTIQMNERPFSLLKRDDALLHSSSSSFSHSQDDDASEEISGRFEDEDGQEVAVDEEEVDPEKMQRLRAKAREEKLQNDLFILRKINSAFASYNDALSEAGSANQRIAAQLAETDALLNKYIEILSKSEEYAKLIFDEEFEGAEADERTLEEERAAEHERRRKEEEERALAEKLERERKQREEEERLHRAELERLEQARKQKAGTRGGVAGVRGTRASMRGAARGATSGMTRSASTRGRPSPPVSSASSSRLPTATAGTRGRVRVTRQT